MEQINLVLDQVKVGVKLAQEPFLELQAQLIPFVPAMENNYYFITSLLLLLYVLYSIFYAIKHRNHPPVFNYLFRALSGEFDMKHHSYLNIIKAGYKDMGDCFTLNVFGNRVTFMVGPKAHTCMFSAKDAVLSQKAVYKFTIPVFGKNIVYDCEQSRMNEQIKLLKHGVGRHAMYNHCKNIIKETIDHFASLPDEGEMDLYASLSELIINTASTCLLGEEIRAELHTEVSELYQQLSDGMKHISFLFPNLPTDFHRKRDEARVKMVEIFSVGVLKRRERNANGEKPDDLLQTLVDAEYKDGSKPSVTEICGLLIAMLFAGQHTSNISATWTGYRILTADDKLRERLLEEQDIVLQESKGQVNFDALEKMELLNNCVRETLRMYPPLICLMRKAIKPLKYKDFTIPAGDIVAMAPPVSNKLPHIFKNPEDFDPDRFFREEDKEPNSYTSFGGGRHACIGQLFGIMQIKTIWSTLLRQFEFEVIDELPDIDYSSIVAGFPQPVKTRIRYKRRKQVIGKF